MANKMLLSICIPTYNRSRHLKTTIESIIQQPEFLNGKVEIVICDNASTDDTSIVVGEFSRRYSNISYYRNKCNIRDKNYPMVLSKGHGMLRKLHNDTLKLEPGSLSFMCDTIEKYERDRPLIFFGNGNIEDTNNNKLLSFKQFVVQTSYWITWIGAFTIWEDDCKDLEFDTDGCDLLLWQVKKSYELGFKKDECVILNKPFAQIQSVYKKDISYGIYKIFYTNYLGLLKPYVEKNIISKRDYELIRKDLLYNFFTNLILQWELDHEKMNYSKEENLKKLIFSEYKNEIYWHKYSLFYRKKLAIFKAKNFIKKLIGRE